MKTKPKEPPMVRVVYRTWHPYKPFKIVFLDLHEEYCATKEQVKVALALYLPSHPCTVKHETSYISPNDCYRR